MNSWTLVCNSRVIKGFPCEIVRTTSHYKEHLWQWFLICGLCNIWCMICGTHMHSAKSSFRPKKLLVEYGEHSIVATLSWLRRNKDISDITLYVCCKCWESLRLLIGFVTNFVIEGCSWPWWEQHHSTRHTKWVLTSSYLDSSGAGYFVQLLVFTPWDKQAIVNCKVGESVVLAKQTLHKSNNTWTFIFACQSKSFHVYIYIHMCIK